jgi:hypothetical protein
MKAQQHTDAAGGNASGTGGSASYSAGQVEYKTITGPGGTVTQGVQQPYEILVLSGNNITGINLSVSVHPNPATDFIVLKADSGLLQNLSYTMFDVQGKIVASSKVENTETTISVADYAKAVYFFKVTSGDKDIKTFKIVKN